MVLASCNFQKLQSGRSGRNLRRPPAAKTGARWTDAVPIIPKKIFIRGGKLREISGLKIYVIAFVWTCVTVIIPLLNENHEINQNVLVESVQRYLYIYRYVAF